jgi:Protein-disulfide isomerase
MALKDQLDAALAATPPDNQTRQETLRAVLAASGSGSDAEIQAALTRLIKDREARVATFTAAGRADAAKAERAEIDALRALLRLAVPEAAKPAAKAAPKKQAAAAEPAKTPMLSGKQILIGAVALVAVAAASYFIFKPKADTASATSQTVEVKADDRTMGNPKAPVVMLEYAAPSCPHCARFNATIFPKIKQEYIDKGKVFYIFRTFPISATDGAVEGIARLCLPPDKYFQFLDLMFRNQPKWDPDGNDIPDVGGAVKQMAAIMGVTPEAADRCMTDAKEQERINQVSQEAVALYHVNQTPTILINGQMVQDTEGTWPQLKARFDALLAGKK